MIHEFAHLLRPTRLRTVTLALLGVLVGSACDNSNPLDTTAASDPMDQPTVATAGEPDSAAAASDTTADTVVATEASLTPSLALYNSGMRFGAYDCTTSGLSAYNLCNRSAGSWSYAEIRDLKAKGARTILNQGGYSKFKDSYGRYSPTKYYNWVMSLRSYASSWKTYVSDGTLVGVQVLDDRGAGNWGGRAITNAQIDQMAKWWKQILPGVPTLMAGGYAWNLTGYTWYYLDGSINQYNARYMGDVKTWRDKSVKAAASARTSLILSLNVLNGGKLVSGCYRGGSSSYCSMTPTELRNYGAAIAAASGICGIGTWKFKSTYQSRSGVTDALKYVASLAAKRSSVSCRKR
jgi:hypothetical protein